MIPKKSNETSKDERDKAQPPREGLLGVAGKNSVTEQDLRTLEGMAKNRGTKHER